MNEDCCLIFVYYQPLGIYVYGLPVQLCSKVDACGQDALDRWHDSARSVKSAVDSTYKSNPLTDFLFAPTSQLRDSADENDMLLSTLGQSHATEVRREINAGPRPRGRDLQGRKAKNRHSALRRKLGKV